MRVRAERTRAIIHRLDIKRFSERHGVEPELLRATLEGGGHLSSGVAHAVAEAAGESVAALFETDSRGRVLMVPSFANAIGPVRK